MPHVFDSSAVIECDENILRGVETIAIPPCVAEEIHRHSEGFWHHRDMIVQEPSGDAIERAKNAATETGDLGRLSPCDIEVIALAIDTDGVIVSGDYSILNTAKFLGLEIIDITGKFRSMRRWIWRCSGCGRKFSTTEAEENKYICPVCGHELRRKRK